MEPEERVFLAFWVREARKEFMQDMGKLLGVLFNAGDIRSWEENKNGSTHTYSDEENILIPLSIALKPELRDGLKQMVQGLATPEGYQKQKGEVMVDLGRVTAEDFRYFLKHKKLPDKENN